MFRTRIIYRLVGLLLVFAFMIVVPYSFTFIKQVQLHFEKEEALDTHPSPEKALVRREFTSRLVEQMVPFSFYVLIMAFFLSIFFLRKMLITLRNLREGTKLMRDGDLDVRLDVLTEDELGDVTKAFNDMARALRSKTHELVQKDMYVNAMLDPLWVVDQEGRIVDINPAFERLFGYEREQMIGASVFDLLDEKNASVMRKQSDEKRMAGEVSPYELSVIARSGQSVPVLVSDAPIFSGDRVIGKIGVLKDFREQGSLRADLQNSLDYIETIMNGIPDELIVIDPGYRIIMANRPATEAADRELRGAFCHEALHNCPSPCWSEGHDCPTQAVFADGKDHKTIHQHADAGGGIRYHEIMASPVKDPSGKVLHVIELLRDVTERVETEAEIIRKNRELTVLNNISGILNRSLKPDEIFTRVLEKLTELLSMDGGGIFFLDETTKEMICQYHSGISDEYARTIGRIRLGEDVPGKVAVTGQIITTSDISRDHRIERSIVKHSGIRGYCCIPIRGKERIIGVFCLFSFNTHVFTPEEETILVSVGEMTGMALENVRLYEKLRSLYEHQQKRWEDEHRQLLTLSGRLGAEVAITDIMTQVLALMKHIFGADFIWMLVNDPIGSLVLRSSSQATGQEGEVIYGADVSSLEKFSLSKRQTVQVSDIRAESMFYLSPEVSAYHSAAAVPMLIGDKPVGVFALYYMMQKDLKEEELHFLEIVANMISVALERSEYYMRAGREKELADTIIQSVTDGILTVDMGNRVVSVNSAFEKLTGISHAGAVGIPVCDNFRFSEANIDFRIRLGESVEDAKQGAAAVRAAVLTTRYGSSIPVVIHSSPILDRGGGVTGVVNLIRDVSREKELDRMKTELIRSVSHEFRTPLSAIVGMTEMLLQGDVTGDKVGQYLNIIRNEGLRLTKMVTELLSLARIESGKEILHFVRIDVPAMLKDLDATISTLVAGKGATFRYSVHDVPYMIGDEENLRQVLMNLIDNSLTFSDKGCIIEMDVKRSGDMVEIELRDNGWGIPEDDLPRLGERFYRGRHGQRIKGTGLGLAICDEIVRMHEGTMTIRSAAGKGTVVTVRIPYREVL